MMKLKPLFSLFFIFTFSLSYSQVIETDGYVSMEMENTTSPLDLWVKILPGNPLFIPAASGGVHLEFTGNAPASGTAKSPLKYTFTITTAGTYKLQMRASKRLDGEADDKCNDCFVNMQGDFTSGYPATDPTKPTTEAMKKNIKFFGGNPHPKFGWANNYDYPYPGIEHNLMNAIFVLKAGQTYTLTVSGRSQRFNPDYFVLFNTSMYTQIVANGITPAKPPVLSVANFNKTTNTIKMYPNPATNVVKFSEPADFEFYNVAGQKILSKIKSSEVNVSSLPRGIYTVRINKKHTQKILLR